MNSKDNCLPVCICQGPRGQQGVKGPQGDKGNTGATGPTGATGACCVSILKGLQATGNGFKTFLNNESITFDNFITQDSELTLINNSTIRINRLGNFYISFWLSYSSALSSFIDLSIYVDNVFKFNSTNLTINNNQIYGCGLITVNEIPSLLELRNSSLDIINTSDTNMNCNLTMFGITGD